MLDFRGPIIDYVKSSCATFYRSSIQTIPLNCLQYFLRKSHFCILATDRQTDKRTNRWKSSMREAAVSLSLAVA